TAVPAAISRVRSFPDLGFERDLETQTSIQVERPGRVQAVDVQRRRQRPRAAETAHQLGDPPPGQSPAPVLGQRADGADEADRLRPWVVLVNLDLPQRDGHGLAVTSDDG